MEALEKDIVNALLEARQPMSRSELAGHLGITIKRLVPHLDALVARGDVERFTKEVGTLDAGIRVPINQTLYHIAKLRLVTT